MMDWKFSVNAGFFGLLRGRFTQYQPYRDLEQKFELIAQIGGMEGIELKHPTDFEDMELIKRLLDRHKLQLSAINVNIKDATYFRYGALSARDDKACQRAITLLKEGMDIAAELGVELVTTCPLADGYDYPFQVDYRTAWGNFIDSVKAVVSHRSDVKLCLEYQLHDPDA